MGRFDDTNNTILIIAEKVRLLIELTSHDAPKNLRDELRNFLEYHPITEYEWNCYYTYKQFFIDEEIKYEQ